MVFLRRDPLLKGRTALLILAIDDHVSRLLAGLTAAAAARQPRLSACEGGGGGAPAPSHPPPTTHPAAM